MTCFDQQGPGIFFVIPCIDAYKCVDLRTVSFDVPPQEVFSSPYFVPFMNGSGGMVGGSDLAENFLSCR